MAKIFSNRENRNTSVGGISPLQSQLKLQQCIANLEQNLEPQEKQEDALNSIDALVGRPTEKLINRELLIPAPAEWNFFPKATEEKIQEMSTSIRQYGLFHNITVWACENGKYMILGGHTRVACFDYLAENFPEEDEFKWSKIPALVYGKDQISEIDAKRIVIVSNTDQRDISKVTKSKAYMELFELEKKKAFYGSYFDPLSSAATLAKTSKTMFFRTLSLLKLIPELQEEVTNKEIPFLTAYNLSFLSKDLQQYIFVEDIYKKISVKAAEQIKDCQTIEEIAKKLGEINNATKYYKYTYQTRIKKSVEEEVLPILVPKTQRNQIANLYIEAVNQSNLEQNIKDGLILAIENAKL